MTPEQRDILADYRAKRIDYGTAYALLAYFEHPAPGLALNPPTPRREQGWVAVNAGQPLGLLSVYGRSA